MSESVPIPPQNTSEAHLKPSISVTDSELDSSAAVRSVSDARSSMANSTVAMAVESSVVNAVPTPVELKAPSVNAVPLTSENFHAALRTRLPNVTLPGPAEGVSFVLDKLGVHAEEILDDEKDFDVALVRVSGGKVQIHPKLEGEHELPVSVHTKDGRLFVVMFLLTVNPDPKSLWKTVPVPDGTPFLKPDRVAFHSDDGVFRIVAASQRGRTHAQQGTCRDDDMAFWSDSANGRYVLVVADGAGSAKFSRKGSKIAVETTIHELSEKLSDAVWASEGEDFNSDGNVCKVLVAAARTAVGAIDAFVKEKRADAEFGTPDLSLKDFNTTLLMAAVKRFPDGSLRGATFSVGDGAIAWWQPETAQLLCVPDGGEFSGQTKFLTTLSVWKDAYEAIQKARCFTFHKAPDEARSGRLFLMSDGVSDPFFETDNMLRNPAEWDKFRQEQLASLSLFGESGEQAAESASGRLLEWLSFWSVGNHDDRTIAILGAAPVLPPSSQECENAFEKCKSNRFHPEELLG